MDKKLLKKIKKNISKARRFTLSFIKKHLSKKRVFAALGIFLLFIILRAIFVQKPLSVQTSEAKYGNLTESISSSGSINNDQIATLTFPTAGKVSWVGVKVGDKVAKWQGIASLDKTTLDVAYQQSLSNLRAAQANLDQVYDSVKGHDVGESFAFKNTRTQAEVAKDNAYDAYRAALYNIQNATIVAPFSGVVVKADPAFAGVNVNPATSSFVIVNPDTFYFEAQVNEVDVTKISEGQKVTLRLDAYPNREIDSTVDIISLTNVTTSTGGNAYQVKMGITPDENIILRQGMNGDAEFLLSTVDNVLLVPSTAIVEDGDKNYVFIVKNGRAKKTEVTLGASSVDFTQVTSGVSEGTTVISLPPANIKDNLKVKTS